MTKHANNEHIPESSYPNYGSNRSLPPPDGDGYSSVTPYYADLSVYTRYEYISVTI